MKICQACKTRYSDDTLRFCLQDGTPLADSFEGETPTVVLGETETVAARRADPGMRAISDPGSTAWQQSQLTHVATLGAEKKSSNTTLAVVATAAGMLLLFGVVGIAALIYLRNADRPWISNANNGNFATPAGNTNYNGQPVLSPTPTPTRSPATPPPTDNTAAKSDVSQRIYDWKSMLESRNFNAYMGNYADTVDYFSRRNVSVGTVRADKARAFALYSSMRVDVSNMSVSVSPSGETATAVFDKEWNFTGRDTSSGKVRSQLEFRNVNGRWLITAEKDLKVYYTR